MLKPSPRLFRPWTIFGLTVFAIYVAVLAVFNVQDRANVAKGGEPEFSDFTPFYAASIQLRQQPPEGLYNHRARYFSGVEAARAAYGDAISKRQAHSMGLPLWMHPPIFIPLVLPLVWLPYLAALWAWLSLTAIPYLLALRRILPTQAFWPIALASPPVFFNLGYGQTGFLIAGLIGLGLALVQKRPVLAGIVIALAAVKPHFGVLIPLALAMGGYWRTFAAATVTVLVMVAASLVAFGAAPWLAFFNELPIYADGFGKGIYYLNALATPLGSTILQGGPPSLGWTLQGLMALAAAALVVWAWRNKGADIGLPAAILCCATLLTVPMAYLYDLTLLVPAIAWIWRDFELHGATRGEKLTLAGCVAASLGVFQLALHADIGLMPLLTAAILGIAVRRLARLRSDEAEASG